MNKKAQGFFLLNVTIFLVNISLVVNATVITGCSGDTSDWKPGDQDQIRKLVSEISDARTNEDKLASLFTEDSVPDRDWLKNTEQLSFAIADVALDSDVAKVTIDLENHFGELQRTVTWECTRSGDGWLIASAPVN